MSGQTWIETLIVAAQDGPTLDGTMGSAPENEVPIEPLDSRIVFPPNFFHVGTALRITAFGRMSCDAGTPGTLNLMPYVGGDLLNSRGNPIALNTDGKTDVAWSLMVDVVCRATGSSGSLLAQGVFTSEAVVGSPLPSVGGSGTLLIPSTPTVVTFDSTVVQTAFFMAALSATTATTSITCTQYKVESLN